MPELSSPTPTIPVSSVTPSAPPVTPTISQVTLATPAPAMIRLFNKTGQTLRPTITLPNGVVSEVVVHGTQASDPVAADSLTPYTDGLVASGHLVKRKA